MSIIRTEITLENSSDVTMAYHGYIKESDIHRVQVNALVDTGAFDLIINEKTCTALGLRILRKSEVELAGGIKMPCSVTEPVLVHWRDRDAVSFACVLPEGEDAILGAFPMEQMDLTINPMREIIGKHGDMVYRCVI